MIQKVPERDPNGYGERVAQFSVRIPNDLHARIRAASDRDGLSMNAWLCLAAEQKLAGALRSNDAKRLDSLEERVGDHDKRLEALEER